MTDEPGPARANLARQQEALARAVMAGGAVPAGFDHARVEVVSADLRAKRSRWLARSRPDLARALGSSWESVFAGYARANPAGAPGPREDAAAFATWLARNRPVGVEEARLPRPSPWRLRLRPAQRLFRLVGALLLGSALVVAGLAGFAAIDSGIDQLDESGVGTDAGVVEVGGSVFGGLLVSFDADGRQVTTRVWTRDGRYAVGDRVGVMYDPREPTRAQVTGDVDEGPVAWFWVGLVGIGLVGLGYALVLVVGAVRALAGARPVDPVVVPSTEPAGLPWG